MSSDLEAYRAARTRAIAFVLGHLHSDGSLGDLRGGFYFARAPWAFAVTGHTDAALATCEFIRRQMLTSDGRLDGPLRDGTAYAYRNSQLIVGAHLLQQFDLSLGLMPDLVSWQDPVSGGFANDRAADGTKSDDMDIPYTCGGGFACLVTGHLDHARRVARYLERMMDAQRDLPHRFFYTWSRRAQRPVTEFAEADRRRYVVDSQRDAPQRWTIGGIAAGFLSRLYMVDPHPRYLELARRYQAFSTQSTPHQFKYAAVCKSSWGSSLLYQLTGEDAYGVWTRRMGDWYVRTQEPDGSWQFDRKTLGSVISVTMEFVVHLDTLIGGLAARATAWV